MTKRAALSPRTWGEPRGRRRVAPALLSIVLATLFATPATAVNTPHTVLIEPRLVQPVTFVVNTTADSPGVTVPVAVCRDSKGHCSLAAAVAEADTLNRSVIIRLAAATYSLAALGELDVTDTRGVEIEGVSASRTVISGAGSHDRVLDDDGDVFLSNLTIEDGAGPSTTSGGGGILVDSTSNTLSLTSVTVADNSGYEGGGILNNGALWLTSSSLLDNTATVKGAGLYDAGGSAEIVNSNITHNIVEGGATSVAGGGVFADGALTISGGTIDNNFATSTSGNAQGGGVDTEASATITNAEIQYNYAGAGAAAGDVSAAGGGVAGCYGLSSLSHDVISNNDAAASGSGESVGGGLAISCGSATVEDDTFSENRATSTGASGAYGGAIAIGGNSGFVTVSDVHVEANLAAATGTSGTGNGGGIALTDSLGSGGGLTLTDSVLQGNQASSPPGAIGNDGGGGLFDGSCGSGSIVTSTTIADNVATNSQGGGLLDASCGDTLTNDDILSNRATGSTTSSQAAVTEGAGGGLGLFDVATITNTVVAGNHASQLGGGVFTNDQQTFVGDTVVDNKASDGGGIFALAGGLLSSTAVVDNSASEGGGLYLDVATTARNITLDGATLSGNVATLGAGIYAVTGGAVLHATVVAGNTTTTGTERDCDLLNGDVLGSAGGNRLGDASCALTSLADRAGAASDGYSIVAADGRLYTFNTTADGSPVGKVPGPYGPVVAIAETPDGRGYWVVTALGHVFAYGSASNFGSATGRPIVGIAPAPDGQGYWLAASNGDVYGYGSARTLGDATGLHIVGIAPTPDGQGYWLAASNGEVDHFGSALALGSKPGQSIVGIASAPDGRGYWLAASNGAVFAVGSAKAHGSKPGQSIIGIAAAPGGTGYWLLGAHGSVFNFGSASSQGSLTSQHEGAPVVGFTAL